MPSIINTLTNRAAWAAESLSEARDHAAAGNLIRCLMRAADARRHAEAAAAHAVGAAAAGHIPAELAARCSELVAEAQRTADDAAAVAEAAERDAQPGERADLLEMRAREYVELADAAQRRGDVVGERAHRARASYWTAEAEADRAAGVDGGVACIAAAGGVTLRPDVARTYRATVDGATVGYVDRLAYADGATAGYVAYGIDGRSLPGVWGLRSDALEILTRHAGR